MTKLSNVISTACDWTTEAGYRALVLEMHSPLIGIYHTGYVHVPDWHRHHGVDYRTLLSDIEVHEGLTFSGKIRGQEGWWLGFDTAHYGDELRRNDPDFCRWDCERLARQLYNAQ